MVRGNQFCYVYGIQNISRQRPRERDILFDDEKL